MKTITDEKLHNEHCEILMREIVRRTVEGIRESNITDVAQQKQLAENLLFSICAILDGSAHPGWLHHHEEEIAPFLGFYHRGNLDDLLVPKDGSGTHEFIGELIEEYFQKIGA